ARLREGDRLSAGAFVVDDHRDLAHRVERQIFGLLVLALREVDGMPVVLEPAFLERDARAHAVRRAGRVEIDHWRCLLWKAGMLDEVRQENEQADEKRSHGREQDAAGREVLRLAGQPMKSGSNEAARAL